MNRALALLAKLEVKFKMIYAQPNIFEWPTQRLTVRGSRKARKDTISGRKSAKMDRVEIFKD